MRTIHPARANLGCQVVRGTTTRSLRFPTALLLTMTAGRVLPISSPTVGSNVTSQTSPLFIQRVAHEVRPLQHLRIGGVVVLEFFGSPAQILVAYEPQSRS